LHQKFSCCDVGVPIPRLRFARFAAPGGGCFHISRQVIRQVKPHEMHTHDFPELFWVEGGTGTHRLDGVDSRIAAGDLVCVRAEDGHTLFTADGSVTVVNLAVLPSVAADLAVRYGQDGDLWAGGPGLRRRRLGPTTVRRLAPHVEALTGAYGGPRERLALDRCLLELVACLAAEPAAQPGPDWLHAAIAAMAADPELLGRGASALAGLCGRSREHVARSLRRHLGESPRALVERLRLERAAQSLRMGDRPILAIALDQGYAGLGHFYRRFKARFGCTPRTYRHLHLEPVRGCVPDA
jgi:AraC family cel operon transcriptional repressor